jgi:cyclopropane-fatty-acyl-phospholipid synthase
MDERAVGRLKRRHAEFFRDRDTVSFAVRFSDGERQVIGDTEPAFSVTGKDHRGDKALASLDLLQMGDAFINGSLDIDGDILTAMEVRRFFGDFHPLVWLGRFLPTVVRGRVGHDSESIAAHYDRDPAFFRTFLDHRYLCYTQGTYESDDDDLESAIERKLEYAYHAVGIKPGSRVLDVGGGWGAFLRYAGERDARVTSLTLSAESAKFMTDLADRAGIQATVACRHFLQYESPEKFDAIVNMGATEHLPDYGATIKKYASLLKPGGKVYIDALAMRRKHRASSFISRHIYPGRSSPLLLHEYLERLNASPFLVTEVGDERWNYHLTCKAWAQRLEAARTEISERWGERLYRSFWVWLWGSAASFGSGQVQAYRLVFDLPAD